MEITLHCTLLPLCPTVLNPRPRHHETTSLISSSSPLAMPSVHVWYVLVRVACFALPSVVGDVDVIGSWYEHQGAQNQQWPGSVGIL